METDFKPRGEINIEYELLHLLTTFWEKKEGR